MRYPLNRPRVKVGFGFGDAWFDTGKQHTGEDDQATAGEPVYAPADAILYNHTVDPKWGNGIVLDFGGSGCTIWHVDHMLPDGTRVTEGQQIATIYDLQGNTHMHLSFWVGYYDESLRAGALFPGVFPDRFVEPDHFLDSNPDIPALPDTGHPPNTTTEDLIVNDIGPIVWPDGHKQLLRLSGGTLQQSYETAGHQWSLWADLLPSPAPAGQVDGRDVDHFSLPGFTFTPDGSLEVFFTKASGQHCHARNDPAGNWAGWQIGDAA